VVVIKKIEDGKRTRAIADMKAMETALDSFKVDCGEYPTTEQGLAALRTKPDSATGWNGPYLKQDIPSDPWGNQYEYKSPGDHNEDYDLRSFGKDGKEGGDGNDTDIKNWTE
jgi:general secretion pathway protein G